MMLLEALTKDGRFGSSLASDLEFCRVPDIFGFADLKVLFIAESPHTEEVRFGAPLSGRSGRDMTRVLLDRVCNRTDIPELLPFGRCMQFQSGFFRHFGVMNVCNLPLQAAVLKEIPKVLKQRYGALFDAFHTIRSNPNAGRRQSETAARVDELILDDFSERLESRTESNLLTIPCGNVARAFVEKSRAKPPEPDYLAGIPHPSYGQWLTSAHRDCIDDMCRRIRERLDS